MEELGTILEALNLQETQLGSAIEQRVLDFAKSLSPEERIQDDGPDAEVYSYRDIELSLQKQGIPQRAIDTLNSGSFEEHTAAIKAVREFAESSKEGWCLVLSGDKGCGKSTAAAFYLENRTIRIAKKNRGAHSFPIPSRQFWWTAAKINRVSSYDAKLENLMRIPVLIIDDLGVEYADKGGHFNGRLDELLSARYDNYKKTIITTNLNAKDFEERYGKRISSRIMHGFEHGGNFVQIEDKSMRK